ncbi:hypothetical protein [Larkinella soli]|uniref:hypothetical protein n=1 Tax=Larkinella soli TaxID=1770527 RepID=UPI000FFC6A42|nr:hypothetical protein [Larkinella soli]
MRLLFLLLLALDCRSMPSPQPPARHLENVAFDSRRNRLVLYGGGMVEQGRLTEYTTLYEWSPEGWRAFDAPGPGGRNGAALVYDEARQLSLLIGGVTEKTKPYRIWYDLWGWNGQSWRRMDTLVPVKEPQAVYDPDRRRLLVYGDGSDKNRLTYGPDQRFELWEYSRSRWRKLSDGGPHPDGPYQMTFDRARRTLVMVDWEGDTPVVWEWKAGRWVQKRSPTDGPTSRTRYALIWSPADRVTYLYGGLNTARRQVGDFWTWDGDRWRAVAAETGPGPRNSAHFAAAGDRLLLFGGSVPRPEEPDKLTLSADLWEWRNGAWSLWNPVFSNLPVGPHPVGFRILSLTDSTRVTRALYDFQGRKETGNRYRTIRIHLWYPARPNTGTGPMTYWEYGRTDGVSRIGTAVEAEEKARTRELLRNGFQNFFGKISDADYQRLMDAGFLARKEAVPAGGPWPLLVGCLRPLSTAVTNELLASHGYLVAMVYSAGQDGTNPQVAYLQDVRDMQLAMSHFRNGGLADEERIGAFGFSGSGLSQVLLAMHDSRIRALADLESALYGAGVWDYLSRSDFYDPKSLKVPFLHIYGKKLAASDGHFEEFHRKKYSERYHLLLNYGGLHHWDVATEGRLSTTVLKVRGEREPAVRASFELANRYLLHFFDATLRQDRNAQAVLRTGAGLGRYPDSLYSLRYYPAIQAPPTVQEFKALMQRAGPDSALSLARRFRRLDSTAAFLHQNALNRLSQQLGEEGKPREALALMLFATESHPGEAWLWNNLAALYESLGNRPEALRVSQTAVRVAEAYRGPETAYNERIGRYSRARIDRLTKELNQTPPAAEPYPVGFRTLRQTGRDGTPLLISLWYPARPNGRSLSVGDLIRAGAGPGEPDSLPVVSFRDLLKRIYGRDTLPGFQAVLAESAGLFAEAALLPGAYPLVIAQSDPISYQETFRFLAAHGFVVAAVRGRFSDQPPGPETGKHYSRFTDALESLLHFMVTQPFVQKDSVYAFGHGGGIQAALYLAMRTPLIRKVVNLDGGFFGPRSHTTLSEDYHPEKLSVPLLHVVTSAQAREEDPAQFRTLSNPILKVTIRPDEVRHHDPTALGRMALKLTLRQDRTGRLETAFRSVHRMVLDFLRGKPVTPEPDSFFSVEKFNGFQ